MKILSRALRRKARTSPLIRLIFSAHICWCSFLSRSFFPPNSVGYFVQMCRKGGRKRTRQRRRRLKKLSKQLRKEKRKFMICLVRGENLRRRYFFFSFYMKIHVYVLGYFVALTKKIFSFAERPIKYFLRDFI